MPINITLSKAPDLTINFSSVTLCEIPLSEVPDGATIPVVAEFEGTVNTEVVTFYLPNPASSYDNADETVGFAAVMAGTKTYLDAYIVAEIGG